MQVTFAKLLEAMNKHRQKLLEIIVPDDEDELKVDDLTYYLSEASGAFTLWLTQRGLYIAPGGDGGGTLFFDPERFAEITAMCQQIINEYDDDKSSHILWDQFGLSGDGDVDYNGGYILIVLDALNIMMEDLNNG